MRNKTLKNLKNRLDKSAKEQREKHREDFKERQKDLKNQSGDPKRDQDIVEKRLDRIRSINDVKEEKRLIDRLELSDLRDVGEEVLLEHVGKVEIEKTRENTKPHNTSIDLHFEDLVEGQNYVLRVQRQEDSIELHMWDDTAVETVRKFALDSDKIRHGNVEQLGERIKNFVFKNM